MMRINLKWFKRVKEETDWNTVLVWVLGALVFGGMVCVYEGIGLP